jgi:hypothetical protein
LHFHAPVSLEKRFQAAAKVKHGSGKYGSNGLEDEQAGAGIDIGMGRLLKTKRQAKKESDGYQSQLEPGRQ